MKHQVNSNSRVFDQYRHTADTLAADAAPIRHSQNDTSCVRRNRGGRSVISVLFADWSF
jgi:hypothetical protein